nr:MATE family efflux transporter [bacterium]
MELGEKRALRKRFISLALPALLEQALIMISSVIMMMFYGQIGVSAVAAIGAGTLLCSVLQAALAVLQTGTLVLVARLYGQGRISDAAGLVTSAMRWSLALSCGVSLISCLAAGTIARWTVGTQDIQLLTQTTSYIRLAVWSVPFTSFSLVCDSALRGGGDMKTPMRIALVCQGAYLVAAYILIFGLWRLPGLGLTGAGLALVAYRALEFTLKGIRFINGNNPLHLKIFTRPKPAPGLMRRVCRVGLPTTGEQVILQLGYLLTQRPLALMGSSVMAAYQVANSITTILTQTVIGAGNAAATVVGNSLGAGRQDIARFYAREVALWGTGIICVLSVVLYFCYPTLAHLYAKTADFYQAALGMRLWFMLATPLICLFNLLLGILRGAGDTRTQMVASNMGLWPVRLALYWLIALKFPQHAITGVAVTVFLDFAARVAVQAVRLIRGKWVKVEV